jgi:hypothetical protein
MDSYEEVPMIKTFRGLLADGGQETIPLHTNDGATGYRIKTFQAFANFPGTQDTEGTLQIWKVKQSTVSTVTATVDFSDQTLLGALYYVEDKSATYNVANPLAVIFDKEIFNQDIYITFVETLGSGVGESMNYYVELEQVKLDLNQNTVATLKDIRNVTAP